MYSDVYVWKQRIHMSGPEEAVLADVSQYPHVRLSWEAIRQLNDYWKKCSQCHCDCPVMPIKEPEISVGTQFLKP